MLLLKGGDSSIKNKQQKTVYEYAEKALAEYKHLEELVNSQVLQEQQKVIVLYELNTENQLHSMLQDAHKLFEKYEGDS